MTRVFVIIVGLVVVWGGFAQEVGCDSLAKTASEQEDRVFTTVGVVVPSALIVYGLVSLGNDALRNFDHNVKNYLDDNGLSSKNDIDDYLQYAPAAAAFGLKLTKVGSAHSLPDMLVLYALSNVLETAIVTPTKHLVDRWRPDGAATNSFPSGHTATAFVAAEFLHQEYKDRSMWISVGGYGVASFVGLLRVKHNRHWISDIAIGAGIGILSTKAVYWAYPHLKGWFSKDRGQSSAVFYPSYNDKTLSLNLSCTF